MSFYQPTTGSLGTAGGTPLNQQPISRTELVRMATLPAACVIQNRPNYVMINNTGSYAFLYSTTASMNGTTEDVADGTGERYVTGSVLGAQSGFNTQGIKLNINPVAWRRCDAAGVAGDVTFVLREKYVQNAGPV